jgi:hypothetical protein
MESNSQNRQADRQPAAAGRYYSANKETLTNDLSRYFDNCVKSSGNKNVIAIISPHAGYVFSGNTAASAFSAVDRNKLLKNIFIIGSSHIMLFDGASVYGAGDFITPLGKISVNKEIAGKLSKENSVFNTSLAAHKQEHSLEVQIPFIQYYFESDPMIVPIIIGTSDLKSIRKIAETLKPWFTQENLFVISSDFSHYPSYKDAMEIDDITANSIVSGNPNEFLNTLKKNSNRNIPGLSTSMCGWTSGLLLMYLTEGNDRFEYKRIDYCNSGDTPYGNKDEVVGYHAIAVIDKGEKPEALNSQTDKLSMTESETEMLFSIARRSIQAKLDNQKIILPDEKSLPEVFKRPLGAFVTLKLDGKLRGCIGRFVSSDPLYEVVSASACSSAFEDARFSSITRDEYSRTEMEITVLGPLRKINDIKEIIPGKHGIYIKKDFRSGTMLPQVATENGWSLEEFLGYTSRDKAGLGWDGWKNADIYIYEGLVLEENKK